MLPDPTVAVETAGDLAPWLALISAHGPWVVLGGVALAGLRTWTKHLCELAPRVLAVVEAFQKDGIKIKVQIEECDHGED